MNYNKYLIKKEKTDLLSSLKASNKKIIKEEMEDIDADSINELKKNIIEDFKFTLELSKDDPFTIEYFKRILANENTNKMVIYDDDIEALWAFVYKTNNEYSYYIAEEIRKIIMEELNISEDDINKLKEIYKNENQEDNSNYLKDLEEYLDTISNKYLNELYAKVEVKDKEITKKENIMQQLKFNIIMSVLKLSSEEVKQIKNIINDIIPEKISNNIKDTFIFYDKYGNKEYFIPEKVKEAIMSINEDNLKNEKTLMTILFYIEANGILKIDKLLELVNKTEELEEKITKKELEQVLKEKNYYVKNDIVYIDEYLYHNDIGKKLLEEKEKKEYKIYSSLEILFLLSLTTGEINFEKIYDIIYKKVKNDEKASFITDNILLYIRMLVNYEDEVQNFLKEEKVKLSNKEREELFELLEEISILYPKWILNGELIINDFICDDELFFEDLSEEEKIELYIENYIAMNGILTIDKMLELLKHHNIELTQKELIKAVKPLEDITTYKNYICFKDLEKDIELVLMTKVGKDYKIIDNIDKTIDELDANNKKVQDICTKYNLNEEISDGIMALMTYGIFNKDTFSSLNVGNGIVLSQNILNNIYKELSELSKNIRCWKYNGYTENEIRNK